MQELTVHHNPKSANKFAISGKAKQELQRDTQQRSLTNSELAPKGGFALELKAIDEI
ncbi:TPA: hypothetical protein ACPVZK_004093 [Vibrio parahaemolyticus]